MIYIYFFCLPLVYSFVFRIPNQQIVDLSLKQDILTYVTNKALVGTLNLTDRTYSTRKIKMESVIKISSEDLYGYDNGTHKVQFLTKSTQMIRPLLFFETISKDLSVGVDFLNNVLIWNSGILVKVVPVDCPQISCADVHKNDIFLGCIDGNVFIFSLKGNFITYKTSFQNSIFSPLYKITIGNYQNGIAIACAHINGTIRIISLKESYSLVKCEKLDIIHVPHIKKLQLYRNILVILHENRNMFIYDFHNRVYVKKEIIEDVILSEMFYIKYQNQQFVIKPSVKNN